MNKIANQFTSIEQVTDQYLNQKTTTKDIRESQNASFEDILRRTKESSDTENIRFSKHAAMRLDNRNISLTDEQSQRLAQGVKEAGEKGIKDSLVMVDSFAFIVNVPNKTVVTAIDQTESVNNVFTNIDGAVIA